MLDVFTFSFSYLGDGIHCPLSMLRRGEKLSFSFCQYASTMHRPVQEKRSSVF